MNSDKDVTTDIDMSFVGACLRTWDRVKLRTRLSTNYEKVPIQRTLWCEQLILSEQSKIHFSKSEQFEKNLAHIIWFPSDFVFYDSYSFNRQCFQ